MNRKYLVYGRLPVNATGWIEMKAATVLGQLHFNFFGADSCIQQPFLRGVYFTNQFGAGFNTRSNTSTLQCYNARYFWRSKTLQQWHRMF